MKKIIGILILVIMATVSGQAQELNARVSVNSDRIQTTDKAVFTNLESEISQLLNTHKWSSATFAANEKIECSFSFTLLEQTDETNYKAELYVQAQRPVYNSTYITTLFNWRDSKIDFEFSENSRIEWDEFEVQSNLTAVIGFYCNMILGLDFDSFSPLGGRNFFQNAQSIATQAQSKGWLGWSTFEDNKNRGAIINMYLDESLKAYRELWYTYHRKGLDEMAANPDRGRTTILNALPTLKELKTVRNSDIILQMFADCKLSEIVSIAEKATDEEKKETYDLLRGIYPTQSTKLSPLTKK